MNKLIAVVGMAGSGKSIATDYLESQGWNKIYFGGVIYDRMRKEGIEITPDSQKQYREALRKEHGMGVIAKILKDDIIAAYQEKDTVLDGLYSWDEYLILKEEFGSKLKLICVCCDKDIRYQRIATRKDRPFNNKDIIIRDCAEIENSAKGGPIAFADYYIFNNGNLDEYITRLNEILKKITTTEGEK
ncbi:MAG: AAA family ATPase [Mycoplasmatota bacterium]|nr:AAA family ATPase [Mycoplasmatota bacterium]